MKFNEQTAKDLVERLNLSNSIIAKWRFRNKIPDKYFVKNDAQEKALNILNKRITDILSLGFINKGVLINISGVTKKKLYSGKLNNEEANKIRAELLQIKIDIAKSFEKKSELAFKKIISDKRIFLKVILKDIDLIYYDRCIKFMSKNTILDNETYITVKDQFLIIALQLKF